MILKGLKVLDCSRVLAGPFCGQILGDLGAHVIKVESPVGDDTRRWSPPSFEGESLYYLAANRNKKSITLNFKNKNDIDRLKSLVKEADIFIENFKVDGLKQYGLDYQSLHQINKQIIYCSISGFGQKGPRAHEPGYDLLIQGLSGLMSITGNPSQPTKVGVAVVDLVTGLYALIGILSALHHKKNTGLGQHVQTSLIESSTALLSYLAMNFLGTNQCPEPYGNAHPTIVPYQLFKTKDRPILITIGNDEQFKKFSECLDSNWHTDNRFISNEMRVQNRNLLCNLIEIKLLNHDSSYWLHYFEGKGFPFGPINSIEEAANDPQIKFLNLYRTMADGKTPCIASPLNFSELPNVDYRKPEGLGASNNLTSFKSF